MMQLSIEGRKFQAKYERVNHPILKDSMVDQKVVHDAGTHSHLENYI